MATNQVIAPAMQPPNDYAMQLQQDALKQKYLEAVLGPMLQQQQGRMVGQSYVGGENAGTALSKVLGAYMLAKSQKDQLQNQKVAAAGYRSARDAEIEKYVNAAGASPSRQQAISAMTSQYPELQRLGEADLAQFNKENTPLTRLLAGIAGGGQGAPVAAPAGGASAAGGGMAALKQMFPGLSEQEILIGLAADPTGKQLYELMGKRGQISQPAGAALLRPTPNGGVEQVPGSLGAQVATAGGVAQAQERAKAGMDPYPIETPQGVQYQTRAQAVDAMTGGAGASPQVPGTVVDAVRFVESRGNPNAVSPKGAKGDMQVMDDTNANPGYGVRPAADNSAAERSRVGRDYLGAMINRFGLEGGLAAYNGGPGRFERMGRDISKMPAETRAYVPAVQAQMGQAPSLAGGGAGFNVPYNTAQKAGQKQLMEDDAKFVAEGRTAAVKASDALKNIQKIRQTLKSGSFQGAFATAQERAAAFGSQLGIPIDASKLSNTQYIKSLTQDLIIPQAKQLGYNPTDADAKRIEQAVGSITTDPAAFDKIMQTLEASARRTIDRQKRVDSHIRSQGSLAGFDYSFGDEPQVGTEAAPMSLDQYLKSRSK